MAVPTQKLSFDDIKRLCTAGDLDRLACVAVEYLLGDDIGEKNKLMTASANRFGGDLKPDSFRRGVSSIIKKLKESEAGILSAKGQENDQAIITPPAKATPKKRKIKAEV